MKYTRYEYGNRRKKIKGKNILIIFIIIGVALLIGTGFSKFLIKDNIIETKAPTNNEKKDTKPSEGVAKAKLYAIQCGYFSKKENADELLGKLKTKQGGFVVQDGDKFRVFSGIYESASADGKLKELSTDGFTGMRMEFSMKEAEVCSEMIVAQIQLLNKLEDKNVKSINTEEFKKWAQGITVPNQNDAQYKNINDMKNICLNLPKDLTKDNKSEAYKNIYIMVKNAK